jgi:GAF domain-containing protein
MKRRSRAGGKPAKAQRPKALKLKGRNAPRAAPRSSSRNGQIEVARLARELNEAREQQTATSEVLQVISSSPGDVEPVFATMLENAARICDAKFGNIFRWDGDALHLVATHNTPPAFAEARRSLPLRPNKENPIGRVLATRTVIHVADLAGDERYTERRDPDVVAAVELGGIRTFVAVPMLKENNLIGALIVYRQEVRPFTDKQIELVRNFAAQAVIAIENARLLSELRQRTAELTESLEQQTATSEVLQVISSSPGDLEPVFEAMLEKAVRICDAKYGTLYLRDGGTLRLVAAHDVPEFFAARRGVAFEPAPGGGLDVVMRTKRAAQVPDLAATTAYKERHAGMVEAVELAGIRTGMAVPMLKEDELIGIVAIHRREVLLFTDKQLALITNFAAQAVIAIENTRLLSELRESLQEQTATSEVLQVISSSPGDVQPVFAAMLEKAVSICDATFGNIYRWDGDALHLVSSHNTPPTFAQARKRSPHRPPEQNADSLASVPGRMVTTKSTIHVADLAADQAYLERNPQTVAAVELGGVRTFLGVPMLKEGELIGAFALSRQEVRPFTGKQIELVKNFAAQAVIAIENARLLNELRQRTEEVEKLNQHLEQRVKDQVGEIERMSRLRRFLPPQVADLIVASGTEKQLESHRREITALFCDLRGFTGFSESSDPEDVMALLREYHAAIGEIIVRYSGTLERYAGDGVMVVFNDPIPVDNPALQAVQMALEMREAIGALTEKWRELGHEIGFGIGIAHGYATLGTIGFEGRFDYAAIGTVSNVASRLCDEAKPGQILVSPRVLVAVRDTVAVEAVGEFELKGIRRPIAAYNVLAALPPTP